MTSAVGDGPTRYVKSKMPPAANAVGRHVRQGRPRAVASRTRPARRGSRRSTARSTRRRSSSSSASARSARGEGVRGLARVPGPVPGARRGAPAARLHAARAARGGAALRVRRSFEWQQDAVTLFILSGVFLYFGISQRRGAHLNVDAAPRHAGVARAGRAPRGRGHQGRRHGHLLRVHARGGVVGHPGDRGRASSTAAAARASRSRCGRSCSRCSSASRSWRCRCSSRSTAASRSCAAATCSKSRRTTADAALTPPSRRKAGRGTDVDRRDRRARAARAERADRHRAQRLGRRLHPDRPAARARGRSSAPSSTSSTATR